MDPSLTSIAGQFDPRIAALLGWIALADKTLVDWVKTAFALPRWAPPLIAYLVATALLLVLMVALGIELTPKLAAQAAILALIAAMLAIGMTALQERTRPASDADVAADGLVARVADEIEARREARVQVRLRQVAEDGADQRRPRAPEPGSPDYVRSRLLGGDA